MKFAAAFLILSVAILSCETKKHKDLHHFGLHTRSRGKGVDKPADYVQNYCFPTVTEGVWEASDECAARCRKDKLYWKCTESECKCVNYRPRVNIKKPTKKTKPTRKTTKKSSSFLDKIYKFFGY